MLHGDWQPFSLPLRQPWPSANGSLKARHGQLYRLQDAAGRIGWGEAAPWPEIGIDDALARRYAEECAHLDLAAQAAGLPLYALLAGQPPATGPLRLALNAVTGPLQHLSGDALQSLLDAGYRTLKIKLGHRPVQAELADLARLAADLPPDARLRLDANRAWSAAETSQFLSASQHLPIESLEEPLAEPDLKLLRRWQADLPYDLAIDESIDLVDPVFLAAPPVRRLILKPPRFGSLRACLALAHQAQASGMTCIVTSSLESACGVWAAAHLAAAIAPQHTHGLATSPWLARDTGPAPAIVGGQLLLPARPGLGFTPEAA